MTKYPTKLRTDIIISTHTLRKEGDLRAYAITGRQHISTHTLRKEGDCSPPRLVIRLAEFQPTPSARRVTTFKSYARAGFNKFQPTPSARRVTGFSASEKPFTKHFNPHPPQGR